MNRKYTYFWIYLFSYQNSLSSVRMELLSIAFSVTLTTLFNILILEDICGKNSKFPLSHFSSAKSLSFDEKLQVCLTFSTIIFISAQFKIWIQSNFFSFQLKFVSFWRILRAPFLTSKFSHTFDTACFRKGLH